MEIQTTQYTLIYAFSRNAHPGALKIGETTISSYQPEKLSSCCPELNQVAIERIKEYTNTAAVDDCHLEYTELAWLQQTESSPALKFHDKDVHNILLRSGYKRKEFEGLGSIPKEWFEVDLDTVKKAIQAVKSGLDTIDGPPKVQEENVKIHFRDEQILAIEKTIAHFNLPNSSRKMLWNAKMRFGKTLCSFELIHQQKYKRVLILTHRPAVRDGWFEDYHKIPFENYQYGSKNGSEFNQCDKNDKFGKDFASLEKNLTVHDISYIYFASMQDLRGSQAVSDKGINKNNDVFKTNWDLIILDEAHEGMNTALGKNVIEGLCKNRNPYFLYLSGTPFNILAHFSLDEVYTWDYIMEQEAKNNWANIHPGEENPYEGLAKLNIFSYDLADVFDVNQYTKQDEDYFSFKDFFEVDKQTKQFIHEIDIKKFLDMLCTEDNNNLYPYSNETFRRGLNHTLWMLPGVDAAKQLEKLINRHPLHTQFQYHVVNVAGEGNRIDSVDEDDINAIDGASKTALDKVKNAIKNHEKTITLSCGRLTTGISVPEWTGVFMLRGGFKTDAQSYLQTIFRAQTPFKNGAIKSNCYVFDFAPDRAVVVINQLIESSFNRSINEINGKSKNEYIDSSLKLIPVIAMKGGRETGFSTIEFIHEVNRILRDDIRRHGSKARSLHQDFENFTPEDFNLLQEIGKIFTTHKGNIKTNSNGEIEISSNNLSGSSSRRRNRAAGQARSNTTLARNSKKNDETEKRKKAQHVFDEIFVRLSLLLFGAVDNPDILTIDALISDAIIDEESWAEFMPQKFTKKIFRQIAHLINEEGIIGYTTDLLLKAKEADSLSIEERVIKIADLVGTLHFLDHETILTPWRVVNLHLGNTIGGYNFYDENFDKMLKTPRWIEKNNITEDIFGTEKAKILEINSKSGVYPLYLAYTLWRKKCEQLHCSDLSQEKQLIIWDDILSNSIFVLCKTKMAVKITNRILRGFREVTTRCKFQENLIPTLSLQDNDRKKKSLLKKIKSPQFWGIEGNNTMKFNAVVGNPPYQTMANGDAKGSDPIYHLFIDFGMNLSDIGTLIHPGRFLFRAGKTPALWNDKILNDKHFSIAKYWANSADVFPTVDIKGGIAIGYWNKNKEIGPIRTFIAHKWLNSIYQKVRSHESFEQFSKIVYARTVYRIKEKMYSDNPKFEGRQSRSHKYDMGTNVLELFPEIFTDTPYAENNALIYGLLNNERVYKNVNQEYIKTPDNFNYYKIFVPKANGSGAIGEVLTTPIIGEPIIGHTETFISMGKFENKKEAEACLKYIKTKFARAMLGTLKVTQDNTRETWANIPLQNFKENSDIDWSKSVSKIDQQLYAKYGLSQDEIEKVESNIQSMK